MTSFGSEVILNNNGTPHTSASKCPMGSILFMKKKMIRKNFKLNTGECKPVLSIPAQLDLMIERGLIVEDRENALDIIRRTSYYRLSAYSLSLKKNDQFYDGITFDNIYELYRFDDAFRKIVFDYASYVEIAFRAYISHTLSKKYGPLGYMDPNNFENKDYHASFIDHLTKEIKRSDDIFVEHHYQHYNSVFPAWVAIECSSFGDLSKLFNNMKLEDKNCIIDLWLPDTVKYVPTWLHCSVYARNIAAHGGRFYNRKFKSVSVKLQGQLKKKFSGESPFAYIFAINKLLPSKALTIQLRKDLAMLFKKYPFAQMEKMGFPKDWRDILVQQSHDFSFYKHINEINI